MLIRDLEYKSGLDRATIRYYEKEGLLVPLRHENGYRDYTQDHLSLLLKIKLLRQLGLPLETIKELQQGTGNFDVVLKKQIAALEAKIHQAERAKAVCIQLREDRANYETLNAEHYLNLLAQRERSSLPKAFSENIPLPYHPWRRYFARMFDYAWITTLLSGIFSAILRIRPFVDSLLSVLVGFGAPFLAIPILAMMLHFWGTTPGKWLFGLSVTSENGNKMEYSNAVNREWEAFVRGYGLGLPVFCLVRLLMSRHFYSQQILNWDEYTEYHYRDFRRRNGVIVAVAVIVLTVSRLLIAADAMVPTHRGELTLEDFAKNYNFYTSTFDEYSQRMWPDGSFDDGNEYSTLIYYGGKPENADHTFEYVLEEGRIESVCYKNTWTDVSIIHPITSQCEIAALTAVMSQRGANLIDMISSNKLFEADKCTDGSIVHENVTVSWQVQQKFCYSVDGEYFANRIDASDTQIATVSVMFLIEITQND